MLEFVAAALGGATKFASPDLRLGSSRRDPCVAPRTKHTGSHGRGRSFGYGNGPVELVVEDGPSFTCFGSVGEQSVDSGGDYLSKAFREQGVFCHLMALA